MSATQELLSRRAAAVADGVATAHPVFIARADGAELWDVDGKHYVDFAAGIAVMNTGHRHPTVSAAIIHQLGKFAHVGFPVGGYEGYVAVCERLNAVAPIKDARTALFSTGAEAVENAVKVARLATGRQGVIAFTGGFHGRTQLGAALTGKVLPIRAGVAPAQPGIFHLPFPMPQHGTTIDATLAALANLFRASIAPDQVAAIIIEPVQGEGGFHQAPQALLSHLRAVSDRHGICLIVDEIQSGFGRTGRFFAIEHFDVEPDLITVGKALGGGLPLAAVIGKAKVMASANPGALGGTFAGNPLACAAALAVFHIVSTENLSARAESLGALIFDRLCKLRDQPGLVSIGDVRQLGAMVAFDIVAAKGSAEPDADATRRVATAACAAGVLLLPCGYYGNTIRLSVPLTADEAVVVLGLDRLSAALKTAAHL